MKRRVAIRDLHLQYSLFELAVMKILPDYEFGVFFFQIYSIVYLQMVFFLIIFFYYIIKRL